MLDLLVFGIPLIIAFALRKEIFDKACIFFVCSLLSYFLTISMLSYTIPLAKSLLGKHIDFLYLCTFSGCGFVLLILFCTILLLINKGSRFTFPDKPLRILNMLLVYVGLLLQIFLLIFGTAQWTDASKELLKSGAKVTSLTMTVCQYPLTEKQLQWLRHGPAREFDFLSD